MFLTYMSNFRTNWMLLTIRSINLFIYLFYINLDYKNMKFKHLIDKRTIDFWSFGKFASIEDIRRKYNLIMDLLKLISNKNILSKVIIAILSKRRSYYNYWLQPSF